MWWSTIKYRSRYRTFFSLIFFTLKITNIDATSTKLCPVLTLPQHAFFFSGYCEREPGSLCGLGCLIGYHLVDGDSFHECQQDGTWTGHQPKCEEIHCPPLTINTRVIYECLPEQNSTNFKFGTKCRAKCNETGYRLIGPHTRECLILGRWTGYEQFCIVGTVIISNLMTSTKSIQSSTITSSKYQDFSNYALTLNNNDTGIVLSSFQSSQFTIIFWFYLENNTKANLISFREINNDKIFEIIIQQNKLVFYHVSQNKTQTIFVNIPNSKWKHFAWIYSNKTQQSYIYIDGVRQQSINFRIINFDFENISTLILFDQLFNGRITRLEIWKEIISEQQLLVSYRDCRKQNGNIFSWSQISNEITIDTTKLKSSLFCSGCSEPASIHGGIYRVLDYDVGSSVDYECDYGYEIIGANRAFCMVPSEWYPLPPICKYNPCTSDCLLCDKKTGVCLRQQVRSNALICDPPCDDDEECIDGECTWTNTGDKWNMEKNNNICNPSCPFGTRCVNRRCEPNLTSYCPIPCRPGQLCVDGRCGCFKGLCEHSRLCYEICEIGERCHNWSCSCGYRGKCRKGEICQSDICMCGTRMGGCRPHEHCINGKCICKTSLCDQCDNACKSNEICLDGKCVCNDQCQKAFCPFPCLNGGKCTGFYQCTCRQGWQGHRCEQRQRTNVTMPSN